ncbi:MAG: hypothetical protein J6K23_01530 [Bacilli bacterium]|nr:hypothetical protein [Bacilli bacterium]
MNKKALKYVLIVSGIVLLLGLGIWGYKYIKNRNDDKKTNESETNLKELANLTSYGSSSVGGYTLNYYYNGPIDVTTNGGVGCLLYTGSSCHKYNYYLTIYVNNSIKLKSSWMFYSFEYSRFNSSTASNNMKKYVTTNAINSKFLIISLINYTYEYYNQSSKTYYPYTKVFDATTGDMIYAVPTNSNEQITINGIFDGIPGSSFTNNMYLAGTSAIYYLKSNCTLTDGNNVEVHKVQFDDSYDNKYKDTIIAYTKGTIKTNS